MSIPLQHPVTPAATEPRNMVIYDNKGFARVRLRKHVEEKRRLL